MPTAPSRLIASSAVGKILQVRNDGQLMFHVGDVTIEPGQVTLVPAERFYAWMGDPNLRDDLMRGNLIRQREYQRLRLRYSGGSDEMWERHRPYLTGFELDDVERTTPVATLIDDPVGQGPTVFDPSVSKIELLERQVMSLQSNLDSAVKLLEQMQRVKETAEDLPEDAPKQVPVRTGAGGGARGR